MLDQEAPAIELRAIRKAYPLHQRPVDRLRETLGMGRPAHVTEHVALNGIDLKVNRGETVGLLGVNGAGKSTLLQIITGTLKPTSGMVETNGRISALLELGAGFNPAWSGRKNAEFQCVLQGVPSEDMPRIMEAIEDFADIGAYFDEPAQSYSSGMYMRVAFAASIAVEPDILIVDEALAVGDVGFQNKCFRRFEDMQQTGTTILFVTHAPDLVNRFCSRGVMLDAGRVVFDGEPAEATKQYMALTTTDVRHDSKPDVSEGDAAQQTYATLQETARTLTLEERRYYNAHEQRSGNGSAIIKDVLLTSEGGPELVEPIDAGSAMRIEALVTAVDHVKRPEFGIIIRSVTGQIVSGMSSLEADNDMRPLLPGTTCVVTWHLTANLLGGSYFLDFGVSDHVSGDRDVCDFRQAGVMFEVKHKRGEFGLVYSGLSVSQGAQAV